MKVLLTVITVLHSIFTVISQSNFTVFSPSFSPSFSPHENTPKLSPSLPPYPPTIVNVIYKVCQGSSSHFRCVDSHMISLQQSAIIIMECFIFPLSFLLFSFFSSAWEVIRKCAQFPMSWAGHLPSVFGAHGTQGCSNSDSPKLYCRQWLLSDDPGTFSHSVEDGIMSLFFFFFFFLYFP